MVDDDSLIADHWSALTAIPQANNFGLAEQLLVCGEFVSTSADREAAMSCGGRNFR